MPKPTRAEVRAALRMYEPLDPPEYDAGYWLPTGKWAIVRHPDAIWPTVVASWASTNPDIKGQADAARAVLALFTQPRRTT